MKWLCCQLGAREHYAIPRALSRRDLLGCLVTDAWIPHSSFLAKISAGSLRDRFDQHLSDARVMAFNSSLILFEMFARARRLGIWPGILARNHWFQHKVVSFLGRLSARPTTPFDSDLSTMDYPPILLSYSYTALEPFRYAKARGWKTVLAQIDPGPVEEAIVAEEAAGVPELVGSWRPAPAEYWTCWREECEIADRIIVNSDWSREGLIRGGIAPEKLSVIPLAYEASEVRGQKSDVRWARRYPVRFTHERPLRVLFLGLINLRKGVARLLEAARILRDEPVEFWMVGPVEIASASTTRDGGRVKWFGPATRKQAADFYRRADVFLLPTLSDGFAITQLEAQAHGLPVISSKFCGKVVENGVNGFILEEPTATCIAATVRHCIANPERLEKLASTSGVHDKFTIEALAGLLQRLGATL